MTQTITDREMLRQVRETLSGCEGNYDADEIVWRIKEYYGLVNINDIPSDAFWIIVLDNEVVPNKPVTDENGVDITDWQGYMPCGCLGEQREHSCEPPF